MQPDSPVSDAPAPAGGAAPVRLYEFIVIASALMAIEALGIDIMLPALPHIAQALAVTDANQQQWIVTAYLVSCGVPQIVYGPLSDRLGRRRVLLFCLVLFSAMSVLASLATSFAALIAMRILQGVAAAGMPVVAIAMVRDRFSGGEMARVMSIAYMVFMIVPIMAPSVGALALKAVPWQGVFLLLAAIPLVLALVVHFRIPETLPPERRRALDMATLAEGFRMVVTHRGAAGYTMALAAAFGGMIAYIASAQQVFTQALGASEGAFPLLFAFVASGMVFASFLNSRIVLKHGTRVVSHTLVPVYLALNALHLALTLWLGGSLWLFAACEFAMLFCLGVMGANFGAMAMEAMGEVSGMAAAVQGMTANLGGSLIGMAIGQAYDGTVTPLVAGTFLSSLGVLAAVLFAERGRLSVLKDRAPAATG